MRLRDAPLPYVAIEEADDLVYDKCLQGSKLNFKGAVLAPGDQIGKFAGKDAKDQVLVCLGFADVGGANEVHVL